MKGSVTVFACILLAAIILLNCVLVDTAKVISLKANMKNKAQLSLGSVLAGFDNVIRDHYGLFALNGTKNVNEEFLTYFDVRNSFYGGSSLLISDDKDFPAVDFLIYELSNVNIELDDSLADTEVLRRQIIEEMTVRTPLNFGSSVLEKIKILTGSKNMSEAYKKQAEVASFMNEVTEDVEALKKYVEGLYEGDMACVNGYDRHMRYLSYLSLVRSSFDIIKAGNEESREFKKAVTDMKDAILQMKGNAGIYLDYNLKAINQINVLSQTQKKAQGKIRELETWLANYEAEDELDLYYKQTITQQKNELRRKVNLMGNTHILSTLNANAGILSRIIQSCDSLVRLLDMPEDLELTIAEFEGYIQGLDNKGIKVGLKVNTFSEENDGSYKSYDNRKKAENDLKDFLKETKAVSIPAEIYKTLPSIKRSMSGSSLENDMLQSLNNTAVLNSIGIIMNILSLAEDFQNFSEDPVAYISEGVLIDDYIMTFFGNTVEPIDSRTGFFTSEVEYIIGGTSSEGLNRQICQVFLFAVRFYMNIIHVMCDMDKTELASNIGNAIASAITCGIGGPLYAFLIIAGWAICESIIDVYDLLEGKEVPLLKRKSDWKLSLAGLSQSAADDKYKTKSFINMSYSDYLRILLAFTGQETKLYRISDLIELNLTDFLNRRINLSTYYTKATAHITVNVEMFSASLLFVPENNRKKGKFILTEVWNAGY